jgi:hypothetical protein
MAPAGYTREPQNIMADYLAVAPDGKVAVAFNKTATNPTASVKIYASAAAAQAATSPLQSFVDPTFKAWGDLTFDGSGTLLFSENADKDTVYSMSVSTGTITPLAPVGSLPNVQGIARSGSTIYATAVNNPGSGSVYAISSGAASTVLSSIGNGYIGGLAFDSAGTLLVADSNDPGFIGAPGQLLRYASTTLTPLPPIGLAAGGGGGAYDVVVDSENDYFVTTGTTITQVKGGTTVSQFGGPMTGVFFFLAGLDYVGGGFEPNSGAGRLFINAMNVDEGAIFGVTPLPEPATLGLFAIASLALLRRRRATAPIAVALAVFASGFVATSSSRADQFFSTQVISRTIGGQQQQAFTDPNSALGPPRGGGTATNSIDVYSLGNGGSITLGFDDGLTRRGIFNGPGMDFIVSENSFYASEDPTRAFAELMFVEVSTDNVNFARFPVYSANLSPVGPFGTIDSTKVINFAGVNPVLANADDNNIDPFDPVAAGGDAFNFCWLNNDPLVVSGVVDLNKIRYVRLVDVIGDGYQWDTVGRPIFDPTGNGIGGADVDSIAVINGTNTPEPSAAALFCAAAVGALRRKR